MEIGSKDVFWKNISYRGSSTPHSICISLTYVFPLASGHHFKTMLKIIIIIIIIIKQNKKKKKKKTQSLKKLGNGECNLDKIELHILNKKKWNLCVKNLEWIFF